MGLAERGDPAPNLAMSSSGPAPPNSANGAKALASVLRTRIEQASRTHRLIKALEDSHPDQRPGITKACSQLEGRPAGRSAHSPALLEDGLICRLIRLVDKFDLDRRDFVIFGSGPLLAHGLRSRVRDLDIVARGTTWSRVFRYGLPAVSASTGDPMVRFWGGLIEVYPRWISDDWDTDDLIDRAEIIQGLPFAPLTDVLAYKQMLRRPKDQPDIEALLGRFRQTGRVPRPFPPTPPGGL